MCVTSYGTEILQSQLNRSEKRRRCTHRNESPCLLRVDGKDGVVFLWFCAASVPPVGFVHSARGYTSSGRSSANEAKPLWLHPAAPEEGKQEKQGKPLHGNVFFFFPSPPTAFHTRYTWWLKFRGRKRTHACAVALILSKKINP